MNIYILVRSGAPGCLNVILKVKKWYGVEGDFYPLMWIKVQKYMQNNWNNLWVCAKNHTCYLVIENFFIKSIIKDFKI